MKQWQGGVQSVAEVISEVSLNCHEKPKVYSRKYPTKIQILTRQNIEHIGHAAQIQVPSGYHRSDAEIKALLEEQISKMRLEFGEFVNVTVVDWFVKLKGVVTNSRTKANAAGAAWELSGVRDCLNMIEIREEPPATIVARTLPRLDTLELAGVDFASCLQRAENT